MSFGGFGVSSGPTAPPKILPSFPSTPPPQQSPPPFPVAASSPFPRQQSSPRIVETPEIKQSPPYVFHNAQPVVNPPFSSDGNVRRIDQRWNAEQNAPPRFQSSFPSTPPSSSMFRGSPSFPHQQPSLRKVESPEIKQSPSFAFQNTVVNPPFSSDGNVRPSIIGKNHQVPDPKRTRSPGKNFRNISQDGNGRTRQPLDYSDLLTSDEPSLISPFADSGESKKGYPTEQVGGLLKRTRSPPLPFGSGVHQDSRLSGDATKRPSLSPSIQSTRSNVPFHTPGSEINQRYPPSMHNGGSEASDTKYASFPAIKRTRSPPLSLSDQVFQGTSNFTQNETEREMQAKAKRAARFGVELSQPMEEAASHKIPSNRHGHSMAEKSKDVEQSKESVGDFSEYNGSDASTVIVGLCPDMCPETERAERERKGDLDHYERLGGDRNQTSKSMAVKKYTRTAEREAGLIRPMPILRNTIEYLLNLLDQPYDDKFLGMYNFLWDRMRAIRMDLRMQHIFNLGAVAMLEQMIRLHIIAMHELCEYTKGEGFSEGFDAHLNIEQMNKTSVELFQLYDDHRKKGINIPTEKEFRGYYALLKLDKHPGYKVEPAELSLDLAKMTPEIRQTPEVLFARDVARACRTGNFIAFFRLARRATYLQACLMHAHFSKLRTQALASLHSGLQGNQGLPISNVSKWLAVEEDDMQSLSDHHGFLLRDFEEPYMVKEGPFLNGEKDYATNCSKLVQLKRSRTISEDVASSSQASLPVEKEGKPQLAVGYKQELLTDKAVKRPSPTFVSDEDMLDFPVASSPKDHMRIQPVSAPTFSQQTQHDHQASVGFPTWDISQIGVTSRSQSVKVNTVEKQSLEVPVESPRDRSLVSAAKPLTLPISPVRTLQEPSPVLSNCQELSPFPRPDIAANTASQNVFDHPGAEELLDINQESEPDKALEFEHDKALELYHEKEAAEGKLRLIMRIWRRHASKKKELRMQRLLAANAAMNSLSLGPLIRQKRDDPSTFGEFNIDNVTRERYNKHGRSWSRLNVSDVVMDQLNKRNSEARCICFKVVVCSHIDDSKPFRVAGCASSWLHSKLIPDQEGAHDDLVKSSPGLSIWKKWCDDQYSADLTCCLSVIRDAKFDILNESVLGASAIMYLVSERIPWELQKTRLHSLLMSIPSYSRLPLLILTDSYSKAAASDLLINKLGLSNFDDTRISAIRVLPVVEDLQVDGFFSDKQLREGLQWLASESPLQPILNYVKTRELVMTRLDSTTESFDEMNVFEVGPNHCISALNEALDQAISQVTETAYLNPSSWPCPEIDLLDEASAEHKAYKMYLPNTGWSSPAKIDPLVCALKESKLPSFSYDISWLSRGSTAGEEIAVQVSQLESCIIGYLTESSKMMDLTLATNEARVMLQTNAVLELHNSTYYIIPRWVMIFRRIFNWRLSHLAHGIFSSAYISQLESDIRPVSGSAVKSKHEASISPWYNLSHPSLDEMVDLSFNPSSAKSTQPKMVLNLDKTPSIPNVVNERHSRQNDEHCIDEGGNFSSPNVVPKMASESRMPMIAKEGGDKLSKLLENCNIMQNMIQEKLSIYF